MCNDTCFLRPQSPDARSTCDAETGAGNPALAVWHVRGSPPEVVSWRMVMTRVTQPAGTKGSLKWIQQAVAEKWQTLESPILSKILGSTAIEWISPLEADAFAEYRDESILTVLRQAKLIPDLQAFWPRQGLSGMHLAGRTEATFCSLKRKRTSRSFAPRQLRPAQSHENVSRVRSISCGLLLVSGRAVRPGADTSISSPTGSRTSISSGVAACRRGWSS